MKNNYEDIHRQDIGKEHNPGALTLRTDVCVVNVGTSTDKSSGTGGTRLMDFLFHGTSLLLGSVLQCQLQDILQGHLKTGRGLPSAAPESFGNLGDVYSAFTRAQINLVVYGVEIHRVV